MITQNVFKSVFDNSLKGFTKSKKSGSADNHRFDKIKEFCLVKISMVLLLKIFLLCSSSKKDGVGI